MELLRQGSYDAIGRIFQEQNIGYVIINHELLPKKARIFLDAYDFMTLQGDEYRKVILGEKIRDFGIRYSMYSINAKYATPTIFLSSDIEGPLSKVTQVDFRNVRNNMYEVSLTDMSSSVELVMLKPYNKLWNVYIVNGSKSKRYDTDHVPAYNFGNAWHIDPVDVAAKFPDLVYKTDDDSYRIDLEIRFIPELYTIPAIILSILSVIGVVLYMTVHLWKK